MIHNDFNTIFEDIFTWMTMIQVHGLSKQKKKSKHSWTEETYKNSHSIFMYTKKKAAVILFLVAFARHIILCHTLSWSDDDSDVDMTVESNAQQIHRIVMENVETWWIP